MDERKLLSLSKARKARERAAAKAESDANSVRFGMTKAERILAATRDAAVKRKLDQHRLDED